MDAQAKIKPFFRIFLGSSTGIFLLLALYVLSIGPVSKLAHTGHLSVDTLQFYQPIGTLYQQSPLARTFLTWYLDTLWNLNS